jgi:predicted amino acid-binding ACT domain protein
MKHYLALTVIANDRPGIVERIADVITRAGGNWLESSMSRLAGKFAGILLVDIAEEGQGALLTALDELRNPVPGQCNPAVATGPRQRPTATDTGKCIGRPHGRAGTDLKGFRRRGLSITIPPQMPSRQQYRRSPPFPAPTPASPDRQNDPSWHRR